MLSHPSSGPNLSISYRSLLGDAAFPIRPLLGLMTWMWIDELPALISLLKPAHHWLWVRFLRGAELGEGWNGTRPVTLTHDVIICAVFFTQTGSRKRTFKLEQEQSGEAVCLEDPLKLAALLLLHTNLFISPSVAYVLASRLLHKGVKQL